MKRKIIIFLFSLALSLWTIRLQIIRDVQAAVTASPSDNASASSLDKLKQIRDLKDKIATKVTQIRQTSQGAVYGQVKEISPSSLTLTNLNRDFQITLNSDIIVYLRTDSGRKESSLVKITKGMSISVFGIYDESKKNLDPRYIYVQNQPVRIIGKILDIDKTGYTVTVKENQTTIVVDFEKYTKTFRFSLPSNKWAQIGFSKLSVGDFVHIFAERDEKVEDRVHAEKIYAFSLLTPALSPTTATDSSPPSTPSE